MPRRHSFPEPLDEPPAKNSNFLWLTFLATARGRLFFLRSSFCRFGSCPVCSVALDESRTCWGFSVVLGRDQARRERADLQW